MDAEINAIAAHTNIRPTQLTLHYVLDATRKLKNWLVCVERIHILHQHRRRRPQDTCWMFFGIDVNTNSF